MATAPRPLLERQLTAELVWFWPRVYRFVTWGVYMNALAPTDSFASAADKVARHRAVYAALRREHCDIAPEAAAGSDDDPLTLNRDSAWYKRFSQQQLRHEIEIDVARTRQEDPYFVRADTQRLLERVLLVWAAQNGAVGYRQGMNELLALIVCALRQDYATEAPLTYPQALTALMDASQLEADAYTLFSHVMRLVVPWYTPHGAVPSVETTAAAVGDASVVWTGAAAAAAGDEAKSAANNNNNRTNKKKGEDERSALQERFHLIHDVMLRRADPQLHAHLQRAEVLPQLYLLRWVRLLFVRELTVEQALLLWDALFEREFEAVGARAGVRLAFLNWVAVAMVVRVREQLLAADPMAVMQLLLHSAVAPAERIERVLDLARRLRAHPDLNFGPVDGGEWREPPVPRRRNTSLDDADAERFRYKSGGWLLKRGGGRSRLFGRKNLKRRWFEVRGAFLSYYARKGDAMPLKNRVLDLRHFTVRVLDKDKFHFALVPTAAAAADDRHYHLYAASAADMKAWVETLRNAAAAPLDDL